jgi:hypothetical protein
MADDYEDPATETEESLRRQPRRGYLPLHERRAASMHLENWLPRLLGGPRYSFSLRR